MSVNPLFSPAKAAWQVERPQWIRNSIRQGGRIMTRLAWKGYLSADPLADYTYTAQVVRGATWSGIKWVERSSAGTLLDESTELHVNRIGSELFGTNTGSEDESIGIDYKKNPLGLTVPELVYDYARVQKTRLTLKFAVDHNSTSFERMPIQVLLVPYRNDVGEPTYSIDGLNAKPTEIIRIPGALLFTRTIGRIGSDDPSPWASVTVDFDIPKVFNDKEWKYDAPDDSTPNFWIAKIGGNVFSANPAMQLNMKIFVRCLSPQDSTSIGMHCGYQISQVVEFHRHADVIPDGAEAT